MASVEMIETGRGRLYLERTSAKFLILKKLEACRGYRARPESLIECLDGADRTTRRLHNVCVTLFRHGLIEKASGMYQLTPSGLDVVGM